jgi:hypothetical protein
MSAWSLSLHLDPPVPSNPPGGTVDTFDIDYSDIPDFDLGDLGDFGDLFDFNNIKQKRSIAPRGWEDLPSDTPKSAPALLLFAVIMTIFFIVTMIVMERVARQAVFRLPVLITYVVSTILLLSGWAFMAAYASPLADTAEFVKAFDKNSPVVKQYSAVAAAAALGSITWALLVADAVIWTLACLRDPGSGETYDMGTAVYPTKTEMPSMTSAPPGYPAQSPMPSQPYAA